MQKGHLEHFCRGYICEAEPYPRKTIILLLLIQGCGFTRLLFRVRPCNYPSLFLLQPGGTIFFTRLLLARRVSLVVKLGAGGGGRNILGC